MHRSIVACSSTALHGLVFVDLHRPAASSLSSIAGTHRADVDFHSVAWRSGFGRRPAQISDRAQRRNRPTLSSLSSKAASVEMEMSKGSLAERWKQIQGVDHWKGLLEPLDPELRKNIIRYGDFNQAVYDSFDTDPHSKYTGTCRYNKRDFFQKAGLTRGRDWGYEVSRYLYATSEVDMPGAVMLKSFSRESWSRESNWIGYVAVATDSGKEWLGRRDIVIVWRGTMRTMEWIDDFNFGRAYITPLLPGSAAEKFPDPQPMIEKGWLLIYNSKDPKSPFTKNSARDQIMNEVKYLINKYKDEEVSITILGHSLGAALAIVNAFDIAANGLNVGGNAGGEPILVTAIVFGCPGVGDDAFKKRCGELPGLRVLRVRNTIDLITHYPGSMVGYEQVGEELLVDSRKSPYLKGSKNPGDWHNLEAHVHLVAGTQGAGKEFKLEVNRDVALVNKSSEFLRDEYLIPGSWWQEKNKGLVQRVDGSWFMPDRDYENLPKPEPLNDL